MIPVCTTRLTTQLQERKKMYEQRLDQRKEESRQQLERIQDEHTVKVWFGRRQCESPLK